MRKIITILFLFIAAVSSAQMLSYDGTRLYLRYNSNSDQYNIFDVATGKLVGHSDGIDPYNLKVLNWDIVNNPATSNNGNPPTRDGVPVAEYFDPDERQTHSVPFSIDKYIQSAHFVDYGSSTLYVVMIPEKEGARSKLPGQLYAFDFETMTPELIAEVPGDFDGDFSVFSDVFACGNNDLFLIRDKNLVPYKVGNGGACIAISDSLIAFYRHYNDYNWKSYKTTGWDETFGTIFNNDPDVDKDSIVVDVFTRSDGKLVSQIIKPLAAPNGGEADHFYTFSIFSKDLKTYYEREPGAGNPYKAYIAIGRNTFTHEIIRRYGTPEDLKEDSISFSSKAYRAWILSTRDAYQDSLDKSQPTDISGRSKTVKGVSRSDYGKKHFDEYKKQLVAKYENEDWALIETIDYLRLREKSTYTFDRRNWVYGVLVIATDGMPAKGYSFGMVDVNKPTEVIADFNFLRVAGSEIKDTSLAGVLTCFEPIRTEYTFKPYFYVNEGVDIINPSQQVEILVFATSEKDFYRGKYHSTWVENTGEIITGKGSENDSIREAQAKLKKEMELQAAHEAEAAEADKYCDACGGTGLIYPDSKTCTACGGHGSVKCSSCRGGYIYKSDGKGGYRTEYCYRCHGSGEVYCFSCGGKGYTSQGGPTTCTKCGGTGLKQQ
jgi:hypothetical protein